MPWASTKTVRLLHKTQSAKWSIEPFNPRILGVRRRFSNYHLSDSKLAAEKFMRQFLFDPEKRPIPGEDIAFNLYKRRDYTSYMKKDLSELGATLSKEKKTFASETRQLRHKTLLMKTLSYAGFGLAGILAVSIPQLSQKLAFFNLVFTFVCGISSGILNFLAEPIHVKLREAWKQEKNVRKFIKFGRKLAASLEHDKESDRRALAYPIRFKNPRDS
ncbi:hypothetical protein KJ780_02025 [Candidatus Micrarchaeota archaeon]|nr:hypothetical protein [Candidatus Micrarchaeota archaeon]